MFCATSSIYRIESTGSWLGECLTIKVGTKLIREDASSIDLSCRWLRWLAWSFSLRCETQVTKVLFDILCCVIQTEDDTDLLKFDSCRFKFRRIPIDYENPAVILQVWIKVQQNVHLIHKSYCVFLSYSWSYYNESFVTGSEKFYKGPFADATFRWIYTENDIRHSDIEL